MLLKNQVIFFCFDKTAESNNELRKSVLNLEHRYQGIFNEGYYLHNFSLIITVIRSHKEAL